MIAESKENHSSELNCSNVGAICKFAVGFFFLAFYFGWAFFGLFVFSSFFYVLLMLISFYWSLKGDIRGL